MECPGSRAWLALRWKMQACVGGAGYLPRTSPQSAPLQAPTRPCRPTSAHSREVSCEPPSPDLQPQGHRQTRSLWGGAGLGEGPAPPPSSLPGAHHLPSHHAKVQLSSAERVLARAGWELQVVASNSFWGRMWTPHTQNGCFFWGLASPRFGVQRAWGWGLPHTFLWELDPTS